MWKYVKNIVGRYVVSKQAAICVPKFDSIIDVQTTVSVTLTKKELFPAIICLHGPGTDVVIF
jgi:hypothetical protein